MILTKEVKIRVNNKHIKYYKNLGYDTTQKNIIVKLEDLKKGSQCKIDVCCDICGIQSIIAYYDYLKSFNKRNIYTCTKCKNIKTIQTKLEKYGNENYNNAEQMKKTCLEKYNDENYRNHEKGKETCLKKYGVENVFQDENIKIKSKKSKFEKYGNENYNNVEQMRKTKIKLYGDENYNNMTKYKKTNLEKYGTEYPMQNFHYYSIFLKNSFLLKKHISGQYYQSSYEKDFLDNYYKKLDISRNKPIKYIYKGKDLIYYPDYYLPKYNLIIEIKSDYYYRKKLNLNLAKKKQTEKQ